MNIFARRIGFFYRTQEWADKVYNTIVREDMGLGCIETARPQKGFKDIVYKDGTMVKVIPAVNGARGNRFDVIYFEPGIDIEIYHCIVAPTLIRNRLRGTGEIYALSDIDALYRNWGDKCYCIAAKEYWMCGEPKLDTNFIEKIEKEIDEAMREIKEKNTVKCKMQIVGSLDEVENPNDGDIAIDWGDKFSIYSQFIDDGK